MPHAQRAIGHPDFVNAGGGAGAPQSGQCIAAVIAGARADFDGCAGAKLAGARPS